MSERRRNEKEEEKREKEDEKRHEKEWDEKWRHNPVRIVTLAVILIWGGVVALIETAHLVASPWWQGWAVFLIGTGVILLLKAAYRLRPEHRRPAGGTVIIGLILIAVGLGDIIGWSYSWPVILIAVGIIIVILAVFRRR
jgi:cation transport ATPase